MFVTTSVQGGESKYFINNHLSFTVLYHMDADNLFSRVVGFEVTPYRSNILFLCYELYLFGRGKNVH